MFETEIVVWGLLILVFVLGAVAAIKTWFRSNYPTFTVWFEDVKKEMIRRGFSSHYCEGLPQRFWQDRYEEGLKPKDAVDTYLKF